MEAGRPACCVALRLHRVVMFPTTFDAALPNQTTTKIVTHLKMRSIQRGLRPQKRREKSSSFGRHDCLMRSGSPVTRCQSRGLLATAPPRMAMRGGLMDPVGSGVLATVAVVAPLPPCGSSRLERICMLSMLLLSQRSQCMAWLPGAVWCRAPAVRVKELSVTACSHRARVSRGHAQTAAWSGVHASHACAPARLCGGLRGGACRNGWSLPCRCRSRPFPSGLEARGRGRQQCPRSGLCV